MFSAPYIKINGHPSLFLGRVDKLLLVTWIDVSKIIPARTCPLRHCIGLTPISFPIKLHVQPVLIRFGQGRFGTPMWLEILQLRQLYRKIFDGYCSLQAGVFTLFVHFVKNWKRLTPKSLPRKQPVSQFVIDRSATRPVAGELSRDRYFTSSVDCPSNSPLLIATPCAAKQT